MVSTSNPKRFGPLLASNHHFRYHRDFRLAMPLGAKWEVKTRKVIMKE